MAHTPVTPYHEAFGALCGVYLEDSWVLSVNCNGDCVDFEIDAVLTPDHPSYAEPAPGEQYCYRRAHLSVSGVVRLDRSGLPPATDASGTVDVGNIDAIFQRNDGAWVLGGTWGAVEARNPEITMGFDEEAPPPSRVA